MMQENGEKVVDGAAGASHTSRKNRRMQSELILFSKISAIVSILFCYYNEISFRSDY